MRKILTLNKLSEKPIMDICKGQAERRAYYRWLKTDEGERENLRVMLQKQKENNHRKELDSEEIKKLEQALAEGNNELACQELVKRAFAEAYKMEKPHHIKLFELLAKAYLEEFKPKADKEKDVWRKEDYQELWKMMNDSSEPDYSMESK